jgi:hypothetical protein
MTNWTRRRFLTAACAAISAACAPASRPGEALIPLYANPAKNEWPPELSELSAEIQAMYRYAASNRETLQYMPCFCGCVAGGHKNNFDCYVREVYPDGRIRLDTMSFG